MKVKACISLLLICLLTACGFQLRGTTPLPEILQRVAVQPNDPYLPLQRQIRELMRVNGVTIVDMSQRPTAILEIQEDDFQTLDISIGADGRIREQSYTYIVTFLVTDAKGQVLMGPETIRSMRIVEFDPNQALSQSLEEKVIRNETRLDAASQLVRRLSYVRNTAEKP
jgi:LPS-assembly lipoprotein